MTTLLTGNPIMTILHRTEPRTFATWSEFHSLLFPGDGCEKRWESDAAFYLFCRGYDPESIMLALEHAAAFHSFEGCPELSFWDVDRAACEAFLPFAPAGNWERDEYAGSWALNM